MERSCLFGVGAALVAPLVKNLPAMWETWVWSLGWEDPLEKGKATHSSILAWRIPWPEEPGGLQSVGSQSWARLPHFAHSVQLREVSVVGDGWWGELYRWAVPLSVLKIICFLLCDFYHNLKDILINKYKETHLEGRAICCSSWYEAPGPFAT